MSPPDPHDEATWADDPLAGEVHTALQKQPRAMTMELARRLGAPEAEIVARLPEGRSVELPGQRWRRVFDELEGLSVHLIVSNGAATLESEGSLGGYSESGPYFNIQSGSLDLHLRADRIGRCFGVVKPSHVSGVDTLSFQLFDTDGHAAVKIFLTFGERPSDELRNRFERLRRAH